MLPEYVIELDWRGQRFDSVARGLRAVGKDVEQNLEAMGPLVRKILKDYMKGVVESVGQRTRTPWPGGTSPKGLFPGSLSKRSGELSRQFTPARIDVSSGTGLSIDVRFSLTGIAAVHERGAVIRPKSAQFLTIPLPPALSSQGVPKKPNARAWKDTFINRSRKGNLLIFQKQADGSILPLYVLKKSVTIPKRLAFQEAFEAGRSLLADKIAQDVIAEFFSGRA